ncbi:hypothetical protein D9M73_110570 [compost metagenome]
MQKREANQPADMIRHRARQARLLHEQGIRLIVGIDRRPLAADRAGRIEGVRRLQFDITGRRNQIEPAVPMFAQDAPQQFDLATIRLRQGAPREWADGLLGILRIGSLNSLGQSAKFDAPSIARIDRKRRTPANRIGAVDIREFSCAIGDKTAVAIAIANDAQAHPLLDQRQIGHSGHIETACTALGCGHAAAQRRRSPAQINRIGRQPYDPADRPRSV